MDPGRRFILLLLSSTLPSKLSPNLHPFDLDRRVNEKMSDAEFCDNVKTKKVIISTDLFVNRAMGLRGDLSDPKVCSEMINDLNDAILKQSAVTVSGFFSPDFVTLDHPYKLPSNFTGNSSNHEFCESVKINIQKAAREIVIARGINQTENAMTVMNYADKIRRVMDNSCDEIIQELNNSKSLDKWKYLDDIMELLNRNDTIFVDSIKDANSQIARVVEGFTGRQ